MTDLFEEVAGAFEAYDRRPAVFDRPIRERVGQWRLPEPVPITDVIDAFAESPAFVTDDESVLVPVHEPDTAELTGEYLLYRPADDTVLFHEFATNRLEGLTPTGLSRVYPAWRVRFFHSEYDPPARPTYRTNGSNTSNGSRSTPATVSPARRKSRIGNADPVEGLRAAIEAEALAEREAGRHRWRVTSPNRYVDSYGGVTDLVPDGIETTAFGEQHVLFRRPGDEPADETDNTGKTDETAENDQSASLSDRIQTDVEVIVDTEHSREGLPAEGSVEAVDEDRLAVSLYWDRGPTNPEKSEFEPDSDNRFHLGVLLDPAPYDRRREALSTLAEDDRKLGWLTGTARLSFDREENGVDHLSAARLDQSQYACAKRALSADDMYCICGPPGTGTTRTLVEIIRAACQAGQRVLAVAPSERALDTLLVGTSTPDRTDPDSLHHVVTRTDLTAARLGERGDEGSTSQGRESLQGEGRESNEPNGDAPTRATEEPDNRSLVADQYLGNDRYQSDVVCATMADAHEFGPDVFDLVVVDEATRASVSETILPITRGERVILAGDPMDSPASTLAGSASESGTNTSAPSASDGESGRSLFETALDTGLDAFPDSPFGPGEESAGDLSPDSSLFDHLCDLYGDGIADHLRIQYRMHEDIASVPNELFYDGRLESGPRNRHRRVPSLEPLAAIQADGTERQSPSNSYFNEAEVTVVREEVTRLLDAGVRAEEVGVVTPFSAQIGKLRVDLNDLVDNGNTVAVGTSDAFRGKTKEAIVVSFVRSNPDGECGVLSHPKEGPRRLNLALTRAQRRCTLVGNFDTLRTPSSTSDSDDGTAELYQKLYDLLVDDGWFRS